MASVAPGMVPDASASLMVESMVSIASLTDVARLSRMWRLVDTPRSDKYIHEK